MRSFSVSSTALAGLVVACSGNPSAMPPSHAAGAGAPATELVAQFDAAAGELPEGLALSADAAYVGFAPTGRVARVDVASGHTTAFAQLPAPLPNQGFLTGLSVSAAGDLYAGLASFVPEVQAGVYRITKDGGEVSLFAQHADLPFPNGLAFDADGALFVTDSGTGTLFRVDERGHARPWTSGAPFLGDAQACDGAGPGFAIGANGIVVERDAIYVVNLDQATLLRVPRESDGMAGKPEIVAGPDCDALGGADGLVRAPDGSFIVAVNRQDKLVRIAPSGAITTLASGPPFDFPASVAYRGDTLYATNFALHNASAGLPAHPGLVRVAP